MLKSDANRFIAETICVCFSLGRYTKAQIMPVDSITDRRFDA